MSQNGSPATLRAGAAMVDITPAMGIQIDGDIGRPRPVEEVRDPIYAKALVLESGGKKLCILSLDIVAIQNRWSDEIRRNAARRWGFDFDAVMVHVTQNHSSTGIGHMVCRDECDLIPPDQAWIRMGDDRYNPVAMAGIEKAIEQAVEAMQPAKIGAASELNPNVAFNRRYVMRDGKVRTNPWGPARKDILYPEGPADAEVGVVGIQGEDGKMIATLLHHTCHPTHGYPKRYISADWPGAWSNGVKKIVGEQCVPLVINGCCGNILHTNWPDPNWVDDQNVMGQKLTDTTNKCLPQIQYPDQAPLAFKTRHIKIPIRELTAEDLGKAKQMLADHPRPLYTKHDPTCVEWDWIYAVGRLDMAERRRLNPLFDYEIQLFKLGSTALVALGGEPFVEGQLKIKLNSPVRHTYVAHMSNGYVGYIPTQHAFDGGGYETWTSNWSQLIPEALDMIADATVELIKEVFEG